MSGAGKMTRAEVLQAMRENLDLYRARLEERGEALLTGEEVAAAVKRIRHGEACEDVAASLGCSLSKLLMSKSAVDLAQVGF